MRTGLHPQVRRFFSIAVVGILAVWLTACTGRGGGQLPPDGEVFKGAASFGFTFSCEDSGGINSPTGRLRIQLSYSDRRDSVYVGSGFSIHGSVDTLDPVVESMFCIGQEPPPGGNELIFLGRFRLTSTAPTGFPASCAMWESETTSSCRFEVIVRDNDDNRVPSTGDFFQIKLSSATVVTSGLDPATVFYTRCGVLSSGNLTVE